MKRIFACILSLALLTVCLGACGAGETLATQPETKENTNKTEQESKAVTEEKKTEAKTEETAPATAAATEETGPKHMLDGKKVIFVGNSYTYYGNCVINKDVSLLKQSDRAHDRGYFYQICKNNGANVDVTNWTFATHGLSDLFGTCATTKSCKGKDHTTYLTDARYDYVFLQERTGTEESPVSSEQFLANVDKAAAFFRAANPDVKICFLVQQRMYEQNIGWLSVVKELPARGIDVIDWGGMVEGIIEGKIAVPGATQTYDRNSFVIKQSADDGYHPNMLTGYITAQMAYSAITGESAVGQDYAFATNAKLSSAFSPTTYITKYYKYDGATTNMKEIFASAADMAGLQTLMDQHLAAGEYKNR